MQRKFIVTYIMDLPQEGARIEQKTDLGLVAEQLRWAGVRQGAQVLDLGCATGTTCRVMAEMVGEFGSVVGIDASASRLSEGYRHAKHSARIQYRLGDAANIPASNGEFDVTWSRFLFEYLSHPQAALAEMQRVTKRGGVVCVSDIDGNCIWHHPYDFALRDEVEEALSALSGGFDPRAGLRLYSLFVNAGLHDIAVDVRPYHIVVGAIDQESSRLWQMKLAGVVHALESRGWASRRATALAEAFMAHLLDPRTFSYSVLISVRGRVSPVTTEAMRHLSW